ncbi:response regulator [Paenibacillus sp. J5C_2022]|uniref:response regulator n=1 Tax=Paenibacillus sp. J5C2022 TaxID=2977129 RepID=UPI0021D3A948|nr:response regulator [Paenibacillus sp. J5C2022]MCU6709154.1 response regulator [Paenibacillus sp. J5C2022]
MAELITARPEVSRLRVLIVDDEYMVLNTLREEIAWSRLGMELVAEATGGKQALEKCAAYLPDLVVIDISMPAMSGLDVIRAAKEDFPHTRFAILTAHQDFAYAQEALHLGALAYVLKTPVLMADMEEMLRKCRAILLGERETSSRLQYADHMLQRHGWDIRKGILQYLLRGSHIQEQDWAYLLGSDAASDSRQSHWQVIHLAVAGLNGLLSRYPDRDHPLVAFSIYQAVHEAAQEAGCGAALPDTSGHVYIIRPFSPSGSRLQKEAAIQQLHARLARYFRNYHSVDIIVGISSESGDLARLPQLLKEAADATELSFYQPGQPQYYYYETGKQSREPIDWSKLEHMLLTECRRDGMEALHGLIDRHRPQPSLLKAQAIAMLEKAGHPLARADWSALTDNVPLAEWIQRLVNVLLRDRTGGQLPSPGMHEDISKAIAYMQEHLHDNLTLAKVAEHIPMNPSYFSHLFKVNTGATFIEHLTVLRMERAKQLLLGPNTKNYMLCDKLGFASYPHFCTQFKKYTGMTPSEYKQQYK